MLLSEKLLKKEATLAVVGMGYVGLPMAIEYAKRVNVIGFDINKEKIENLKNGVDETNEVSLDDLKATTIRFSSEEAVLEEADFIIVAVPTPVDFDHTPNNTALIGASESVGRHIKKGAYVVFESTVYPGMTEELCIPIIEKESGLKMGTDFKAGYSPERINPGDKKHSFRSILKVVSGSDKEALKEIAEVYKIAVAAGVYPAESIKVAESAKIIENTQRDINIAFMNELSILFHKMDIDTKEVLKAASTKWNFLSFEPGLVGGHCIGVDPYYLTYKAKQIGYDPQVILAGRHINDSMAKYVADTFVKKMILMDIPVKNATVAVCGVTFKENCPDIRNSKVFDIIKELREFGVNVVATDPLASKEKVKQFYGENLIPMEEMPKVDGVIVTTNYFYYKTLSCDDWKKMYSSLCSEYLFFDVKGEFSKEEFLANHFKYWRL